ncbi:hypothetical protein GOP47_0021820 [Adiantum capillus-veneris]|nr:hypothetical protein GOP47_0021820 [Adiantum capillus-veneris]
MAAAESGYSLPTISAACICTILLLWVAQRWWTRRKWSLPPSPPAWPVIGHLHLLAGGMPHVALAKISESYGPILHIRLGSVPTLVVSTAELAREVLFTHDKTFATRPFFGCAARLKGGQDSGLAMARTGPAWSELRKISHAQLFTASKVKAAMPIIMEEVEGMMEEVRRYAKAGQVYNITKGTSLLLENIICRLLMGQRLHEVSDLRLGSTLKEKVQEGVALFSTRPMVGDFIPWLGFLDIMHKRRIDRWIDSLHALLHRAVATRDPSPGRPKDFLDSLLLAGKDYNNIKVVLVDFLAGGVDTPSVTLDWAMAELLLDSKAKMKLKEELMKVVGGSSETLVQEEHLPNLVYTKAIVKEILRLHTPVPLLMPHMATGDCEVVGYNIQRGTRLFVNVWAIGRDPKSWGDNAVDFYPDRFLEKSEQIDVRGQNFELLPFGSGRRMCPGIPLALPIVEVTLANLIHSFEWSLPPNYQVDMKENLGSVLSRATPLLAIPSIRA